MLSYIPLSYSHKGIVSTLVGAFDFSAYAGAAISSYMLGLILINANWIIIPMIWMITGLLALFLCKKSMVKKTVVGKGGLLNE